MAATAFRRRTSQRWVAGAVLCMAHAAAPALSTAPPPPAPLPGEDLLRAGRCAEFAVVARSLEGGSATEFGERWRGEITRGVERSRQQACLAALPERTRNAIFLAAASVPDHTLLRDYAASGGQLALIRNDRDNLATTAARAGDLALLQWLRDMALAPLDAHDRANELAAAAGGVVQDGWQPGGHGRALFDWLLQNGYQLPADGAQGHQLLSALLRADDLPRLRVVAERLRREGKLAAILRADGGPDADKPLAFFADSPEAVALLDDLGANLHASYRNDGPSALFRLGLSAGMMRALLARKVSAAGTGPLGHSPLRNALQTLDADLVDEVLAAGASLQTSTDKGDDIVHEPARISQDRLPPEQLRRLVRVLVKHGADPRSEHAPYPLAVVRLYEGDLPVHTAVLAGNVRLVPVWLQESGLPAGVRHPKSGLSLMGFALQHTPYRSVTGILKGLAAAGVPASAPGESLPVIALRGLRAPSEELLQTLLSLGADLNAVHAATGTTALAELLQRSPYMLDDCLPPGSGPCQYESRAQRLALVRWFVAHGARPDVAAPGARTPAQIAAGMQDAAQRRAYEAALANAKES